MRIWKVTFTVLTIISASLGLMNIISYDVTMPIMFVFMGLTFLTNAKDCYDKGAKKDAIIFGIISISKNIKPIYENPKFILISLTNYYLSNKSLNCNLHKSAYQVICSNYIDKNCYTCKYHSIFLCTIIITLHCIRQKG